jgi:Na+/phosphate symporter
MNFYLGIKTHTQNISKLMKQVHKDVAEDVFIIFIEQLKDQAFRIDNDQSEILGESCLGDSDILGKNFEMDFLISTPKNLIEDAKQEIQRMINKMQVMDEEVKNLGRKNAQKGKYSNISPSVSFTPFRLPIVIMHNL